MAKTSAKLRATADGAPTPTAAAPSYWLMKSEPDVFSWDDLVRRGVQGEPWTGVRNYQARNYMRQMRIGDLALFYHSNIGKEVVGVMEVIALAHPDPTADGGPWECVDVRAVAPLPKAIPLSLIKQSPNLANMVLVKNSRLSVQPLARLEFLEICRMGGLDQKALKAARGVPAA